MKRTTASDTLARPLPALVVCALLLTACGSERAARRGRGRHDDRVTGFDGSSEVELALLQGSVDGMSGQLDSRQAALESGDQTALVTFDRERAEIAPDAPTVLELDLDAEQRKLIEAHLDLLDVGRPIVGPPSMEDDALRCLREGLAATVEDPALATQASKAKRPFNYLSGEDLDQVVDGLLNAHEEYVTVLKRSFAASS